MTLPSWGTILLACFLMVIGLPMLIPALQFEYARLIQGCLAIAAAICLFLGK